MSNKIVKRIVNVALFAVAGIFFLAIVGKPYIKPIVVNWIENQHDVSISSASISVRDLGAGSPAVIIINGMGCSKNDYLPFQELLSKYTRVISYDRPGLGFSGENNEPRTLDYFDKDLVELLKVMSVEPPYILVGHSMGGLFIRYFANLHPKEVAGLVFLDSSHEDWWQFIRETWSEEDQRAYFEFWDDDNPDYTGVSREEKSKFEENCNMVRGIKTNRNIPVLVFTGGQHHHFREDAKDKMVDRAAWISQHESLTEGVVRAKHLIGMDMGHWLQRSNPDFVISEMIQFFDLDGKAAP